MNLIAKLNGLVNLIVLNQFSLMGIYYLDYLREYFEIEYREDKGDRTENGMTVFDCPIPNNYELLKVIPIIDLNLFKGKDITLRLVFRPTIKEIINEK